METVMQKHKADQGNPVFSAVLFPFNIIPENCTNYSLKGRTQNEAEEKILLPQDRRLRREAVAG